jgi:hypothetical protein
MAIPPLATASWFPVEIGRPVGEDWLPAGSPAALAPLAGVPHHSQVMSTSRSTRFTGDRVPVLDACART